jgi:DNA-binding FadR family transcriptional regulator
MTLQLLPRCRVAATLERRSFWWRLIDAIEAIQRRRAEQVMRAHLRRHRGEPHNEFTRELERRFLGQ